jgi:hypothetical protein
MDKSLELTPDNLITLCESKKYGITCHLFVGHRGNYRLFNPDVVSMSGNLYNYLKGGKP